MISSEDISFVVQGPVLWDRTNSINLTEMVCESIRLYYPDSEIILSTWVGTLTENIKFDKVIFNEDPGFIDMTLDGVARKNNTNRMIVSTYNGLIAASKKYVFRIRSDLIITNNRLLNLNNELITNSKYSVFYNKIIILPSVKKYTNGRILFSLSDWAYFGLKHDLICFYNLPLMDENDLIKYDGTASWENNLVAEQYLIKTYFQQFEHYSLLKQFHRMYDYSRELSNLSNHILKNNFLILNSNQFSGLKSLKYENPNYLSKPLALINMIYYEDLIYLFINLRTFFDIRFYLYCLKKIKQFFYAHIRNLIRFSKYRIKLIISLFR